MAHGQVNDQQKVYDNPENNPAHGDGFSRKVLHIQSHSQPNLNTVQNQYRK